MTFLWPEVLWLLLPIPAVWTAYAGLVREKRRRARKFAHLKAVAGTRGTALIVRRRIPPLLFLLALALMIVGVARPAAVVSLPFHYGTVILAIDVSGSMRATDVEPDRFAAAKAAARAFVEAQGRNTRLGVVAFAGTASVVQQPTQNREEVLAAIERLQLQHGTAIGSAVIVSLAAIFPDADISAVDALTSPGDTRGRGTPLDTYRETGTAAFEPVPPGSHTSAAIVLLTDGQATAGPDPIEAARMAAERGVRVYTVGIGTPGGITLSIDGWRMRVRLDEDTLKTIAKMTHGEYFHAGNARELNKVYQSLSMRFVLEKRQTEIGAFFAAAAGALMLLSAALSLLWFDRIL